MRVALSLGTAPIANLCSGVILSIGFSRLYEDEHWLTDVLGGYLSGVLWLSLFIFLYRWIGERRAKQHARKMEQQQGA